VISQPNTASQNFHPFTSNHTIDGQLVEVDLKVRNRFVGNARSEQIQYLKLTEISRIVPRVKNILFEDEEKAMEWRFRMNKSDCMG
jgi:hypothetical protein